MMEAAPLLHLGKGKGWGRKIDRSPDAAMHADTKYDFFKGRNSTLIGTIYSTVPMKKKVLPLRMNVSDLRKCSQSV